MPRKREGRHTTITDESILHFPLAPLGGYSKDGLFSDERFRELDELILTLSHVYNDLKAAMMIGEINREFTAPRPEKGTICKFFGQNVGLDNYAFRLQVGIFVELIQLLQAKTKLFSDTTWKQALSHMEKKFKVAYKKWLKVMELVTERGKAGSFEQRLHTFMVKVRAHGGYHYYQTKPFADGYTRHFSKAEAESQYAYACLGRNFEETRFFFADAAITSITEAWKADLGERFNIEFRAYLSATNEAIRTLVCSYLKIRKVPYVSLEK